MSILDRSPRLGHDGRDAAKPDPRARHAHPAITPGQDRPATTSWHSHPAAAPGTLTAARLKVSLTLDAAELNAIKSPKDKQRITFRIRLPDRAITAEIAAKSLRKAQAAICEAGADTITLMLQGRLIVGDVIAKAGLSAQPKATKPPPRSEAPKINHGSAAKCVEVP